jgi:anaerobic selenocysteine-containing dehydrogenase
VLPNPKLSAIAPVVLYRTIELPDESRDGAVVFGVLARAAMENPAALARAGFTGSPLEVAVALFERVLASESGVVFAVETWADTVKRARTSDGKFHLALPDLLDELAKLAQPRAEPAGDPAYPFVLSAGERRSFTANTIIRDPEWRKKGADGALRIHPEDAAALGVTTGETVRLTTRRRAIEVPVEVSASMHRGHVSLPNGLGLAYPGSGVTGVAPNELTSTEDRDPFVGTPWHKHVPARVERI